MDKKQRRYIREYMTQRRKRLGIPTRQDLIQRNKNHFLQTAREIHKNKYDYSLVLFKNSVDKVTIICPLHGKFIQSPIAHTLQKQGCPKCAHNNRVSSRKRKTTTEFIAEASLIHKYKYDYSTTQYINIKTKVNIICYTHGSFTQEAKAHLRGQGCPVCANEARASFYESKGERIIVEYLQSNNIQFIRQKTFPECKNKMVLRYDFFIPSKNTLIEFDGEQHYKFFPKFHRDIADFEVMQKRDKIKDRFAQDNNLTLVRILWNEMKQIPAKLSLLL